MIFVTGNSSRIEKSFKFSEINIIPYFRKEQLNNLIQIEKNVKA
jgi:hypothetical protein